MNEPQSPDKIIRKPQDNKILVIEKNNDLIQLYSEKLRREGFGVKTLTADTNVINEAAAYQPDLVLMPVRLETRNGLEIAEQLRAHPQTARAKIIIVTSVDGELERQRAKDLGVSEYLIKTHIKISDIAEAVKDQLGIHDPIAEDQDSQDIANS